MTNDDDAALVARAVHELIATQNSDAWAWAEAFVGANPDAGLDAATMVGWFSGYWSTVYDPLTNKNSDLAAALERAQADAENADRRLKSALALAWPTWVRELLAAADDLSFHAQTSGGTAGRDDALVTAIDRYAKAREVAEENYIALARAALEPRHD